MQAKITHALPDVRDLRTSGNGCYQSPPFLRPRDQKKRRLWGREWFHCAVCIHGACLKWLLPELSFSDRWSRGTKTLGTRLMTSSTGDEQRFRNPCPAERENDRWTRVTKALGTRLRFVTNFCGILHSL